MSPRRLRHASPLLPLLLLAATLPAAGQKVTSPEEFLGHQIGADYFLASYSQLQAYWTRLAGESPRMLQQRALAFVAGLNVPEAIVVTHAGVIRVLLAHWRGLSPAEWPKLVVRYGSLTTVEVGS